MSLSLMTYELTGIRGRYPPDRDSEGTRGSTVEVMVNTKQLSLNLSVEGDKRVGEKVRALSFNPMSMSLNPLRHC